MRMKISHENEKDFKCCCCFHVRTGTIIWGVLHLLACLFALCFILVLFIRPDVLINEKPKHNDVTTYELSGTMSPDGPRYMAEVQKEDRATVDLYARLTKRKITKEDKIDSFLIWLGMTIITVMLIYGASKGSPGYLMPFFCFQVFDFCLAVLVIVAGFTSVGAESRFHKHFRYLWECSTDSAKDPHITLVIGMTILLIIMFIKAYFIGVVWACYRYLHMRRAAQTVTHYMDCEAEPMMMPPKYEEAVREQNDEDSPPAYTPLI